MTYLGASIQGYLLFRPTIQKSERRNFYGVVNFSDLPAIEYSLPLLVWSVPDSVRRTGGFSVVHKSAVLHSNLFVKMVKLNVY
jgi:hypothetical protein